jgi:Kef-type K+ transport system membrane component KefB
LIGFYIFHWLGNQVKRSRAAELEPSGLLIAALAYALIAGAVGLDFIIVAFLAGLFFVHRTIDPGVYQALRARIATFTSGFLVPLFFARPSVCTWTRPPRSRHRNVHFRPSPRWSWRGIRWLDTC